MSQEHCKFPIWEVAILVAIVLYFGIRWGKEVGRQEIYKEAIINQAGTWDKDGDFKWFSGTRNLFPLSLPDEEKELKPEKEPSLEV